MKIGSLFTGYGGLDIATENTFNADTVWHCDNDPAATAVLDQQRPNTPNHGDITTVEWDQVEPVDILTGGFPCQDISEAGRRAGLTPDTRSGLWEHMARAIHVLRPRYVIAENVRGLLYAEAHSDLEPCPWCLGDGRGKPLRALGAVLGDLASLGYDARWCGLPASDVGAPHERYRVFLVAVDTFTDTDSVGSVRGRTPRGGGADLRTTVTLLPTPRATGGTKGGPNQTGSSGDWMLPSAVNHLLPTPSARDANRGAGWADQPGRPLSETIHRLSNSDPSGETTGPPSPGGNTAPAALPPDPPNPDVPRIPSCLPASSNG